MASQGTRRKRRTRRRVRIDGPRKNRDLPYVIIGRYSADEHRQLIMRRPKDPRSQTLLRRLARYYGLRELSWHLGVHESELKRHMERHEHLMIAYNRGRARAYADILGGLTDRARQGDVSAAALAIRLVSAGSDADPGRIAGDWPSVDLSMLDIEELSALERIARKLKPRDAQTT